MNLSRLFILRPIATALLMVAILIAGLMAYRLLPTSALPEVDYPTIQVTTLYPGASPDVMTSNVTAPLERQFGQMPGLDQMSSTSSGGASVISLRFALDMSMDVAEQQVQAAINAGTNLLPRDLPMPPLYSKVNAADAPVLTLAISSPSLPVIKINDLVENRLAPKLSQVKGVGLVAIAGARRPAVRIQANPAALASFGMTLDDVDFVDEVLNPQVSAVALTFEQRVVAGLRAVDAKSEISIDAGADPFLVVAEAKRRMDSWKVAPRENRVVLVGDNFDAAKAEAEAIAATRRDLYGGELPGGAAEK